MVQDLALKSIMTQKGNGSRTQTAHMAPGNRLGSVMSKYLLYLVYVDRRGIAAHGQDIVVRTENLPRFVT